MPFVTPARRGRVHLCALVAGLVLASTFSRAGVEAERAARATEAEADGSAPTSGLPLVPTRRIAFETDQGTWLSVDVAPDGRTLLFDLDRAIQGITRVAPAGDPNLLKLTGVYHNLLRRWAVT